MDDIDELLEMLVAEVNAPAPPPTEAEIARDRFVAEHPYTVGEFREGAGNEDYKGTREPALVVGLAEAGVKRMKAWLGKDMQWVDFALISTRRDRDDLDAMAATGERQEAHKKNSIKLTPLQKKLVAKTARTRHKYMQRFLTKLGYKHWLSVVGKWSDYDEKGNPTGKPDTEYSFFVPNVSVVKGLPKNAPLRDRLKPHKSSAKFKSDMLALGRRFTQQGVILRVDKKTALYDTFETQETVVKTLNKIYWGMEALKRLKEVLGGGLTRPRATGDESEARFLLEVCAFDKASAKRHRLMYYSSYRGGMLTVD